MGAGNADDQAGCRQNSVIGSQNGRPQPAQPVNGMTFTVFCEANHLLLPFRVGAMTADAPRVGRTSPTVVQNIM
jgi:hypothetical protein